MLQVDGVKFVENYKFLLKTYQKMKKELPNTNIVRKTTANTAKIEANN